MKIVRATGFIIVITSLILAGCASAPIPVMPSATPPAPALAQVTPTVESPATSTPAPSPSQTSSVSMAASSTPILAPIRPSPAALMLHRSSGKFDSAQFLKDFVGVLKQNKVRVVTYRELGKNLALTNGQEGRLFLISIDDIYLRYPIDPSVMDMIHILVEAGYPAVLGVVTEGYYAYPETVATLKKLQDAGWEIASHSDSHRNLAEVEKIAPKSIYPEIKASLDKLESALGLRPITLILPEGQMTRGDMQIKRSAVLWVVGINGGNHFNLDEAYHYLGREGPDGSAQNTFAIMLKRFSP